MVMIFVFYTAIMENNIHMFVTVNLELLSCLLALIWNHHSYYDPSSVSNAWEVFFFFFLRTGDKMHHSFL